MKFSALVVDYDGTIATLGQVADSTIEALQRVTASGRTLIMATGRILPELLENFPEVTIFDRVVAEDGALVYNPKTKEEKLVAEAPPKEFLDRLIARQVVFQTGRVIIGTHRVHLDAIQAALQGSGLSLELSFNKSSLMILPKGVNKAKGLETTLAVLGIPFEEVVGVGDAENDQPFLRLCGLSVTLANGVPQLQQVVDKVMPHPNGDGVRALIDELLGPPKSPKTSAKMIEKR